jgi:hypothetical protein
VQETGIEDPLPTRMREEEVEGERGVRLPWLDMCVDAPVSITQLGAVGDPCSDMLLRALIRAA